MVFEINLECLSYVVLGLDHQGENLVDHIDQHQKLFFFGELDQTVCYRHQDLLRLHAPYTLVRVLLQRSSQSSHHPDIDYLLFRVVLAPNQACQVRPYLLHHFLICELAGQGAHDAQAGLGVFGVVGLCLGQQSEHVGVDAFPVLDSGDELPPDFNVGFAPDQEAVQLRNQRTDVLDDERTEELVDFNFLEINDQLKGIKN